VKQPIQLGLNTVKGEEAGKKKGKVGGLGNRWDRGRAHSWGGVVNGRGVESKHLGRSNGRN